MAETAYAIAYRAFQGEGGSPVDRQQTLSAQQALAVLLPQATSFEDVGIILGQGGSLATLRALVESGHLRN